MMTSNLLSRFRSNTEPAATSIYQTIKQHDDDSDGTDIEASAGLAFDRPDAQTDLHEFGPSEVRTESPTTRAQRRADRGDRKRRVKGSKSRKSGRAAWMQQNPDLVDVEEADDDVPASLLIEGSEHDVENENVLPPPPRRPDDMDNSNGRLNQRQWERTQALQELHPPVTALEDGPRTRRPATVNALAMADPKEKAMWRWANVQNLDNFLNDVYGYYLNHGFWSILLRRLFNHLTIAFIVGFSLFLTQCIDYRRIKGSTEMADILIPQCTSKMGFFPNAVLWLTTFIWLIKLFQYVVDLRRLINLHDFYHHLLGVPEAEIQSISWQEIVSRLMALRDSNPTIATANSNKTRRFLGTQNKQRMDAHDIANRLMRKDNYMVAMINKDILDMTLPIPGLRDRQLFTRTLKWNLDYCIMDFVFDHRGQVRQLFLKDTHRKALSESLRHRFIFAGTLSLIIAPFLVGFSLIQNFFQYFNEYQKNPGQIGLRQYNVLAEWKFREFNELWHLFQRRLNMSHPFAMRYINQFPKDKTVQAARFVTFVSGALVSVLGLATILDQESFLGFEITPGRTTIFYLGIFGSIWAVARGLLPDDNMVYDSSYSMEEVIDFTHYRPAHWEGRLHTVDVKTEFSQLYNLQITNLAEEVLSMIFTPFVLWFSLPKCSEDIIDFFREFTVHVDGVGYVCSFAEFNFKKPGNTIISEPNTRGNAQGTGLRDEYFASKDHKLEQSYWGFINDYARNPKTDVRFAYNSATARRRFNMPPPFPGPLSPTLQHADAIEPQQSVLGANMGPKQSQLYSPRKTAKLPSNSPFQSLLLDPHHLPTGGSGFGVSSPQALRPRHTGGNSMMKSRHPASRTTLFGRHNEDVIAEDTADPGESQAQAQMQAQGQSDSQRQESGTNTITATGVDAPFSSSAVDASNTNVATTGSWKYPEDLDPDLNDEDTDDKEDDIEALTGERGGTAGGVIGLMRQFQRAQGEGTRVGTGTGV